MIAVILAPYKRLAYLRLLQLGHSRRVNGSPEINNNNKINNRIDMSDEEWGIILICVVKTVNINLSTRILLSLSSIAL